MPESDDDAVRPARPGSAPASPFSRWGTPAPLAAAAGIVAVQGIIVTLLAIADAVSVDGSRLLMGVTAAIFFVAYGIGLLVCAWGLNRMRSWSRGPALLSQLIWLGIAWNFRASPTTVVAIAIAVSAVLVLLGLLTPTSVEALNRPEHRNED